MRIPKHTFDRLEALVERVRLERIDRWEAIQGDFVAAVEAFDLEYAAGSRESGWYQAKARYFNDLIVGVLSELARKPIAVRTKKRSQLFEELDVDICFPGEGMPIIAGEVKALGTPPHPKNQMKPRSGSQDLHKRVREVAFTAMDLKVAYAPPQPIGSFQRWIDSTNPGYFAFWAIRASDHADFERVRRTLANLRAYCNGVGALIYLPDPVAPGKYTVRNLSELSIDRSLREMAQRIA